MKLKPRLKGVREAKNTGPINRAKAEMGRISRLRSLDIEPTASPKGGKAEDIERLVSVAIMTNVYEENEETHHGCKSHADLRQRIGGYDNIYKTRLGDLDGFWTSKDRFVTRSEAKVVGSKAGQCQMMQRELLSSDVDW